MLSDGVLLMLLSLLGGNLRLIRMLIMISQTKGNIKAIIPFYLTSQITRS